jgi:MFS superfamily sulfate permease-like transporter
MKLSSDLYVLLLPAIAFVIVFGVRWWIGRQQISDVEKSIKSFIVINATFMFIMLALNSLLPRTAVLSTFGRPDEITSLKEVVKYLQDYNDALVGIIEAVRAFFNLFMFWLVASLIELSRLSKE